MTDSQTAAFGVSYEFRPGKPRPLPLIERLHELFEIIELDGSLWLKRKQKNGSSREDKIYNSRFAGHIAGFRGSKGRLITSVDYTHYFCSRLIFAMMNGYDPGDALIDHADRNFDMNRAINLRPSTNSQNLHNRGPQINNTSGYKGVYFNKERKKWYCKIHVMSKIYSFGYFESIEHAARIYRAASVILVREFSIHWPEGIDDVRRIHKESPNFLLERFGNSHLSLIGED